MTARLTENADPPTEAPPVIPAPLNVTGLFPCLLPKHAPATVTGVVQDAEWRVRLAMLRGGTLNGTPLPATPLAVATTFPVAAPAKAQEGNSGVMANDVVPYQLMSDRYTR